MASIITPFGLSHANDAAKIDPITAILHTPEATASGVQAFAQCYTLMHGDAVATGHPLFLIPGMNGTPVWREHMHPDAPDVLPTIVAALTAARVPRSFGKEMLHITSSQVWLFAFRGLVIMQANDILPEIKAAQRIGHQNVALSTWARSAYATLRFTPPTSAHGALHLAKAIPAAINAIGTLRAASMGAAHDAGFVLGSFAPEDIQAAVNAQL